MVLQTYIFASVALDRNRSWLFVLFMWYLCGIYVVFMYCGMLLEHELYVHNIFRCNERH